MKAVQLFLFGVTDDQNTFMSELWGKLTFVPTGSNKWKDNCRHCLLWVRKECQKPNDECISAPCSHDCRKDGKDGYFSIHDMPRRVGYE